MTIIGKKGVCVLTGLLIGLGLAAPAHAYLDPGSGSMMLQLLLGGMAGLVVIGKLYWHNLMALLGLQGKDTPPHDD